MFRKMKFYIILTIITMTILSTLGFYYKSYTSYNEKPKYINNIASAKEVAFKIGNLAGESKPELINYFSFIANERALYQFALRGKFNDKWTNKGEVDSISIIIDDKTLTPDYVIGKKNKSKVWQIDGKYINLK